jgi:virginiamycin A acetyltransferase
MTKAARTPFGPFERAYPAGASGRGVAELRRSAICGALLWACRVPQVRVACIAMARRLEGGEMYSHTIREVLLRFYGLEVGAYSYGECTIPGAFPPGVSIGRYVSIAAGVRVFRRNHPTDRLSTHPFFYNQRLGLVERENIPNARLVIEHDVWIGERAIITPRCGRIGLGAVIGAGSVVTEDVPDFAIVAGVPAKLLRYRFAEGLRDAVRRSRWWERSVWELARHLPSMVEPLDLASTHPLLPRT